MINSVPANTNNAKSSKGNNVAVVAGSTLLGVGGGRLALKAAGYDKFVKGELEELSGNVKLVKIWMVRSMNSRAISLICPIQIVNAI